MMGNNAFTLKPPRFATVQVKTASLPTGNVTLVIGPANSGNSTAGEFESERKQIISNVTDEST